MIKNRSVVPINSGGEGLGLQKESTGNLLGVMELLCVLIMVVMVEQIYMCIKIHGIVH